MTERMDHNSEIILGYIEGDLDDVQRQAFEESLSENHELRQLVSQMKLDKQALRGLGVQGAPVGMIDHVIQTHERAALLGDPELPEPLPLSSPASRWKLRRVVAYGSIAAVLLLSFGVVFQTLIPPGLLSRNAQLAQHEADADGGGVPDVGPGIALLDEDRVYDTDTRAVTQSPEEIASEPPVAAIAKVPDNEAPAEPAPAMADATMAEEKSDEGPADDVTIDTSTLALAPPVRRERAVVRSIDVAEKTGEASAEVLSEAEAVDPPVDTDGPVLARVDTETKAVEASDEIVRRPQPEVTQSSDAFVGYASETQQGRPTQLLVNSASPTQARRDLRSWAINNSARLVSVPSTASTSSGNAPVIGRSFSGMRSRTLSAKTKNELRQTHPAGDETQLIVEVDEKQLPELLAYLNNTRGQSAELISQPDVASGRFADAATEAETNSLERLAFRSESTDPAADKGSNNQSQAADEKDAEPSKAVANRLVDTRTGWNQPGLARGMVSTPAGHDPRNQTEPKEDAERSADKPPAANTPDAERPAPKSAFDWSKLLEPRKSYSPVQPQPAPVKEKQAPQSIRLQVIIRQVADEPVVGTSDDASNEEPTQPTAPTQVEDDE